MKQRDLLITTLLTVGTVLLLLTFADILRAKAAAQQRPGTQDIDTLMCPLSDHQVEESMKAFEKMMPTFQNPRCANCHGGVNPFSANTDHAGGKFDVVVSREGDLMFDETFGACQGCHGGLKGWQIPTSDLAFVGKDAIELCKQMKFGDAENFIDHITRDRGKTPFIETGFAGMRGLNQDGIDFYEALNDKKLVPEPPPITQATFIEQAKAWVDANGGEFKGNEACGCEPQRYALQVDESFVGAFQASGAKIDWDGSTTVQIPLKFNDDKTFTGEATSQRTMNAKLTSKLSCTGSGTSDVKWQVDGKIDDENNLISFSMRFTPSPATVKCELPVPLPIPIDNSENPNNPLKKMEMGSFIGETKSAELKTNIPNSNSTDKFQITIIKLK